MCSRSRTETAAVSSSPDLEITLIDDSAPSFADVVVIGAGITGIHQLYSLSELGLPPSRAPLLASERPLRPVR